MFSVVGTETRDIPMHLDSVFRTDGWILGMMLFIAFLLLALAKRLEPRIFGITLQSFFTLGTPESLQKFEVRFNASGFILLGFSFLISLWVCFTLYVQHLGTVEQAIWYVAGYELTSVQLAVSTMLIILSLIVYNFFGLFLTSWLTGEKNLMRVFITQSWVNQLFFGFLFFALGVIWLLNSSASSYFFQAFLYLFAGFYVVRLIKILVASLLESVSWYYIILYLCTLEILPVVVLYYYVAYF